MRETLYFNTYFQNILERSAECIDIARRALTDVEYDTMVGIGLSGSIAAPLLANALGKKLLILRKDESSHTNSKLAGKLGKRWLFVDDFIATGHTLKGAMKLIQDTVERNNLYTYGRDKFSTQYVGTYEYQPERSNTQGYTFSGAAEFLRRFPYKGDLIYAGPPTAEQVDAQIERVKWDFESRNALGIRNPSQVIIDWGIYLNAEQQS